MELARIHRINKNWDKLFYVTGNAMKLRYICGEKATTVSDRRDMHDFFLIATAKIFISENKKTSDEITDKQIQGLLDLHKRIKKEGE